MVLRPGGNRSQLFTLRVWTEETAEGRTEWRGKLERVMNGETLYFRDWEDLLAFLNTTLALPTTVGNQAGQSKGEQREELET